MLGELKLWMSGQGPEGKKGRTEGAKRGLLTVFKAVAVKVAQAAFVEFPGHHAAPQDSSVTWSQQAGNEEEEHRDPHPPQVPAARGSSGPRERVAGSWSDPRSWAHQLLRRKARALRREGVSFGVLLTRGVLPARPRQLLVLCHCAPCLPPHHDFLSSKDIALLKVSPYPYSYPPAKSSSFSFFSLISLSH